MDMLLLSLWCLDSKLTAGAGKRTCLSVESDEDVDRLVVTVILILVLEDFIYLMIDSV